VLVFYAGALVAMCAMVALVIDLAQLRSDRRITKRAADVAARAGVDRLQFGPWSGVCKARDFLLSNAQQFSAFDAGSETWSNAASPPAAIGTSPCPAVATAPDAVPCSPSAPATWAKLHATARGGSFTIDIQSGYALPDSQFPDDAVQAGDNGDPARGACDNLAVIVTQRQTAFFAQVFSGGEKTVKVRSVGRLRSYDTPDIVAALQLLERDNCNVLQTGGANTRVVVQPFGSHPGIIQIDSADDSGTCPQPILNAQATSGGPSVVACSTQSTLAICNPGTGNTPSRIGIYALNLSKPSADIATAYPSTYGDTAAIGTAQTGRGPVDHRYRTNMAALDTNSKTILTGNSGRPPGCTSVVNNSCTGNGVTWLVLQQSDCNSFAAFFLVPGRTTAQNIFFNCDINVNAPLALTAANSTIVVTGQLAVNSTFTITDPRAIYVGGRSTGNKVGLDLGGATSVFSSNLASVAQCALRTGPGHITTLVIGDGRLNVASGAVLHLCQTMVYMANGFGKLPASDGTLPCTNPCSGYLGTVGVTSGAFVDWSAPNEITGRAPTPTELATTNRYEDLALWTEAGGNTSGMTGGSATSLTGVYFMPNADSFNLAGGGSLPIYLSAQFISRTLKVTGGATINLVPNADDAVPITVYETLLVR
jgi:hypothetical protein